VDTKPTNLDTIRTYSHSVADSRPSLRLSVDNFELAGPIKRLFRNDQIVFFQQAGQIVQGEPGLFYLVLVRVKTEVIGAGKIDLTQIVLLEAGELQVAPTKYTSRQVAVQKLHLPERTFSKPAFLQLSIQKNCVIELAVSKFHVEPKRVAVAEIDVHEFAVGKTDVVQFGVLHIGLRQHTGLKTAVDKIGSAQTGPRQIQLPKGTLFKIMPTPPARQVVRLVKNLIVMLHAYRNKWLAKLHLHSVRWCS